MVFAGLAEPWTTPSHLIGSATPQALNVSSAPLWFGGRIVALCCWPWVHDQFSLGIVDLAAMPERTKQTDAPLAKVGQSKS